MVSFGFHYDMGFKRTRPDWAATEGVFSMLYDSDRKVGQGLVADRRIKAVGFTGSRGGGVALMKITAAREESIPVYAEMSSINPVIIFPHALKNRGVQIAENSLLHPTQELLR
jgi:alpha-ketoglutaric semialdehyde dehydrogenase